MSRQDAWWYNMQACNQSIRYASTKSTKIFFKKYWKKLKLLKLFYQRVVQFSDFSIKFSSTYNFMAFLDILDVLSQRIGQKIKKRKKTARTKNLLHVLGLFKGCKTMTSQNRSYQAQVKRKVMFCSQGIQVFVFLTIPWFTISTMSWWVLVHKAGCIFEYIFWTTTH